MSRRRVCHSLYISTAKRNAMEYYSLVCLDLRKKPIITIPICGMLAQALVAGTEVSRVSPGKHRSATP